MGDKEKRTQYRTESDLFGLPDDHRDAPSDYGRPPDETVAHDLSCLETRVQEQRAPRPGPASAATPPLRQPRRREQSVTMVSEVGSGVIGAMAPVSEAGDLDAGRRCLLSGDSVLSSDPPIVGAAVGDDVNCPALLSAAEALCSMGRSSDLVCVNISVPTGELPAVVDDVRDELRSEFSSYGKQRSPASCVVVDDGSVVDDWTSVRGRLLGDFAEVSSREEATGIADFDALEGKSTGRKNFAAVGNSPGGQAGKVGETDVVLGVTADASLGDSRQSTDVLSQTKELIEKSQKVNEGMISEMLVHIADHTTSVADLLKQITERTERGRAETLEHCKEMVTCMSESILGQAQQQIHTVAHQQRADMAKLQDELARTSRATSFQIQRQSAEIQEQVRGMVSNVAKKLDESMSQQGAQLLSRCKQMLSEREQAMRSSGEDNIGRAAVSTSSASTNSLSGGKTMPRDEDSRVHVETFGATIAPDAPVLGSTPASLGDIVVTQPLIDPRVERDNVLNLVGGAPSPPQSSTAATSTVKTDHKEYPVSGAVAGAGVWSDNSSGLGLFSELVGCVSELNRKITSLTMERPYNNVNKGECSGSGSVPVEEQTSTQTAVSKTVDINQSKKDGDGVVTPAGKQSDGVDAPQSKQKNIMRPKEYDGKEPVNSYLAHFRVCAEFNKWSEDEKRSWLQWSLKDRARQALWDEPNCTTMSFIELEKALRSRFGSEHQREVHKMELENRRRRPHESLSDLMQDIRRLMVLGYGNEQGPMWESVAIKSFLGSLDDPHLAIEIRKQRPVTLDAAYQEALLLDGYYRTTPGERGDAEKGRKRDQARSARVDEEKSMQERNWQREMLQVQKSTAAEIQQMLRQMQMQYEGQRERELLGLAMSTPHAGDRREHRSADESRPTMGVPVTSDREEQQPMDRPNNYRPSRGRCYRCNGAGHYARNCPAGSPQAERSTGSNSEPTGESAGRPHGAAFSRRIAPNSTAYLPVYIGKQRYWSLLDTGSEISIIPSSCIRHEEVVPNCQRLIAANGTEIDVDGEAVVDVEFDTDLVIRSKFLVSCHVNEIMLGLDWLQDQRCVWDFDRSTVRISGRDFRLSGPRPKLRVRRVVLQDDVTIPPFTQKVVKARTIYGRLKFDKAIWATEAVEVTRGVRVARTLVKDSPNDVLLPVMNASDTEVKLRSGEPLTSLEEVDLLGTSQRDTAEAEVSHIEHLWSSVDESVRTMEREELRKLLTRYSTVFSKGDGDLGRATAVMHKIDTGTARPVRQTLRRQPIAMQAEIDANLRQMEEQGIIYPSQSEWASNIVVVKKKDGSLRCCVDYRQLNERTVKDAYPLPRIDDCLDTLAGAKLFSTFDLRSGYYQVAMDPQDAHKTTFTTRRGTYAFKVMPFGLCNAPATFQRLMDVAMTGLNFEICLVYLDDIIVFSKDVPTHLKRLEMLFQRLQAAGLKLKPSKCSLLKRSVGFLGYVVSDEGVSTDPSKIEAIQSWPTPRKLRDVRSFLGLCGYYRRFVENFSGVAAPLHALTQKGRIFEWSQECQKSFEDLKIMLTSSPVLTLPQNGCQYILDTDASEHGIGAVLSQIQEGQERVISYASRLYSTAERRYCVTRKELLAVVYFLRQFRQYLLGTSFVVRTDHAALQWLRRTPEPLGQQGRWLEAIEEFDFVVQHRPGRAHANADALSRKPCRQCGLCQGFSEEASRAAAVAVEDGGSPVNEVSSNLDVLRQSQSEDPEIRMVMEFKQSCEQAPAADTTASLHPAVKVYLTHWPLLEVRDGILYRRKPTGDGSISKLQVLLPEKLREDFLQQVHSGFGGGHLGSKRTARAVQERAYWVGWGADTRRFCQRCAVCARYRRGAAPKQGTLQDMTTGGPWERLGVDITGPHPKSSRGHIYILTVIDYFTKWADAFPIRNQEASTVAKVLVERVFAYFGTPLQILTDQGSNFQSELFVELLKRLEVDQVKTSPYKPSTNGLIERFHRTLNSILGKVVSRAQREWDEWLPYALAAYRATVHETTNFSPNFMVLGRENRLPIDLVYGAPESGPSYESEDGFVARRQQLFRECYRLVRDNLQQSAERRKWRYDMRVKERKFEVGDKVYYFYPRRRVGVSPKWQRFYEGPYEVVARLGPVTYTIQRSPRSKPLVVHVDKLKACASTGGGNVAGDTSLPDPVPANDDDCTLTPPAQVESSLARGRPRREIRTPARYRDDCLIRRVVLADVMHRCRQCGSEFPTFAWLKSHVRRDHNRAACTVAPEPVTGETAAPRRVMSVHAVSDIAVYGSPEAYFSPDDQPLQMMELRQALVGAQFHYYRRNLAAVCDCLFRWHQKDRGVLQTATADVVQRLRSTAPGAAMTKETLTAVVVAAKKFSVEPPASVSTAEASVAPVPVLPPFHPPATTTTCTGVGSRRRGALPASIAIGRPSARREAPSTLPVYDIG